MNYEEMTVEELTKELERINAEKKAKELEDLAYTIRKDVEGRLLVEVAHGMIFLWNLERDHIVTSVINSKNWNSLVEFFNIMSAPSQTDMDTMEYEAQESPESRRNGYGAE